MMKQLRLDYPTSVLSRMLVVSASGYYAWVDRPPSKRAREEVRLELEIKAAHKRTRQTYGPERLQRDLTEHGVRVGIGRIKRIRKKLGIRCASSRVPGSGVRGRGSGERETTSSSLAGKEESSRKEDNSGQGKGGPAGAIAQGGNGR